MCFLKLCLSESHKVEEDEVKEEAKPKYNRDLKAPAPPAIPDFWKTVIESFSKEPTHNNNEPSTRSLMIVGDTLFASTVTRNDGVFRLITVGYKVVQIEGIKYAGSLRFDGASFTMDSAPTYVVDKKGRRFPLLYTHYYIRDGLIYNMEKYDIGLEYTDKDEEEKKEKQVPVQKEDPYKGFPRITEEDVEKENKEYEKSEKQPSEEIACLVCFDRPSAASFLPCNHNKFCRKCAWDAKKAGFCPSCRSPINLVLKTFN